MRTLLYALVAAAMTGCAASQADPTPVQVAVEVTREVEVTRPVEVTREVQVTREVRVAHAVEVTREVEVTRLVEVTPRPSPTSTPLALVEAGTPVQYNRWEYAVREVRRTDAMNNVFETKYAGGQYVVVFLEIKNLGTIASKFDERFLVIKDSSGRTYQATESLLAHSFYGTQNWHLDDFQPSGNYMIPLAYDVAKDAQELILRPANSTKPAIRLP